MLEVFSTSDAWISLLTLTALEIVLGIDNIIFISILASRVPVEEQAKTRKLGLLMALGSRLVLLAGIAWISKLTYEIFSVAGRGFSVRDLILIFGGLFLIAKATYEIYHKVELQEQHAGEGHIKGGKAKLSSILIQIALIDLVFSLDSVITAVGMVQHVSIMVLAVLISIAIMMIFARAIGDFVDKNPSIKILALSFLVMIGALLVGEGFGEHFNKGYVYFAMAFSILVDLIEIRYEKKHPKVKA